MAVELTSDQRAFARRAMESGRFESEEDAVREALALWEERERATSRVSLTVEEARDRWRVAKAARSRGVHAGAFRRSK